MEIGDKVVVIAEPIALDKIEVGILATGLKGKITDVDEDKNGVYYSVQLSYNQMFVVYCFSKKHLTKIR
jgi:hypothetical protein